MTTSNLLKAFGIALVGIAVGVGGVTIGEADDAPGASLVAILVMLGAFVLAFRVARRKA